MKLQAKIYYRILVYFLITGLTFNTSQGATIVSAGDGNFNDPSTWVGGVLPGPGDSVVISPDQSVDVVADDTVGALNVYSNVDGDWTILDIMAGQTLIVNGNVWIQSDPADPFDEPWSHVRLRGTLIVNGDLHLSTAVGAADPAFVKLRMVYTGGTLVLSGDIKFHGTGGVIDARVDRATTVKLVGSSAQTLEINSDVEYYNIIINNSSPSGVTLGGELNLANLYGDFTIQGGKFSNNGYSISGIGGYDFTIKDGTTYILQGTTTLPTNFNHVIESGANVEYGGSDQSVPAPNNSQNYHHLTISGTGTKTLTDNIVVDGDLTLSSSTLDVDDFNNYSIEVKGDWINSGGTFQGRSGDVTFSGGSVSLTGTQTFSGGVYVTSGATLNTNGNLILASGASLMHGTGTPGGGGTVTGNVSVKRTGSSQPLNHNFWSSPVTSANVTSIGIDHYYYDPDSATGLSEDGLADGWIVATGNMTPGLGYTITGGGTASFTGTVNNAPTGTPITIDVKKNAGASNDVPYNLIGNPFPSAIDATEFMNINGPDGNNTITGALYFWDDDGTNGSNWTTSDYAVWTGAGSVTGPNSGTDFDGYIASGQSFFVIKVADGTDQIEFRNSMRSTTNDAFFKRQPIDRLWISLTNDNNEYNETLIAFLQDATDSIDALYDAEKLRGNPSISLYTKIEDGDFAIQALPTLTTTRTVQLGIDATYTGNYTLHLKELQNLDESVVVLLEDTETGDFQNLRQEPDYTFTLTPGSDIQRFLIHFTGPVNIKGVEESCAGNDGSLIMSQPGTYPWNILITDDEGHLIQTLNDINSFTLHDLKAGEYHIALVDSFGYQLTKTTSIASKNQVMALFNYNEMLEDGSPTIAFHNLSQGADQYHWDFGDGYSISGQENVSHTYAVPGVYDVTLIASNQDCDATYQQRVQITKVSTGIVNDSDKPVNIFSYGGTIYLDFQQSSAKEAKVTVYDMLGQRIYSNGLVAVGQKKIDLDSDNNTPGYYLVKVQADSRHYSKKIFISSQSF